MDNRMLRPVRLSFLTALPDEDHSCLDKKADRQLHTIMINCKRCNNQMPTNVPDGMLQKLMYKRKNKRLY